MSIFEIPKNALLSLSDEQLEELVARLAEAEVMVRGGDLHDVKWAGSINAPDDGVDVRVCVPDPNFTGDFVLKPNTIFQVKKPKMPPAKIQSEMLQVASLAPVISEQAELTGAYIIVSLAEDNAEPERNRRLAAMRDAVLSDPNRDNITLDFYDRSRLHQWLRQYPGVMLWVRNILGLPLSGWQPHGRWSPTPHGQNDAIIFEEGVRVRVPVHSKEPFSLEDALIVVRQLIQTSNKATRITGLSGVGKTRFIQALFEEEFGKQALDRTKAIYVDAGADPDPSARSIIDTLISEGRDAIMVLDNCPSDLHGALATRVSNSGAALKLITIEYDIREDKPQTTEVVHIEAHGPEIAEKLVLRRFSAVGQANARRIAEFSEGNARVALALAERVEMGESLAQLSDTDLFNRLFHQRHDPDDTLRERAEILSLVYSFSVEPDENGVDELGVLAELCEVTRNQMYRSCATLLNRQTAQKRGHWRAILPHAIANRLASSALNCIPISTLRATFESADRPRLLKSFSRRLGYLHDHPVAQEIVGTWLADEGLLSDVLQLNDLGSDMLQNVAPVAPTQLLDLLEREINKPGFAIRCPARHTKRSIILSMLISLAYEPEMFDRCIALLLNVADDEDPSNNYDNVRDKIKGLFQAYLSGTHATLDQRVRVARECLWSDVPERRDIGIQILTTALSGPHWTGFGLNEFGARSRDFGYQPNPKQLLDWLNKFLSVATDAACDGDDALSNAARNALAQKFRELWWNTDLRSKLTEMAEILHRQCSWVEGWKAVRSAIYFDYKLDEKENKDAEGLEKLQSLEAILRPQDLFSEIRAIVVGGNHDHWVIDDKYDDESEGKYTQSGNRLSERARALGQAFIESDLPLSGISNSLFNTDYAPYRQEFGIGMAQGSNDHRTDWSNLLNELQQFDGKSFNFAVLTGFIEGIEEGDPDLAREILDECVSDPLIRPIIVGLHPAHGFSEVDLDRCLEALTQANSGVGMYGNLLWQDHYGSLPLEKIVTLAETILAKDGGGQVVLDALSMKLHGKDLIGDILGPDFRRIGLLAATRKFVDDNADLSGGDDYRLSSVLQGCLSFPGFEAEKVTLLDSIFAVLDVKYGFAGLLDESLQTIASNMTEPFLDRVFCDNPDNRDRRLRLFRYNMSRKAILGKIEIDQLIDWCNDRQDPNIWPAIAGGLMPFISLGKDKEYALTDQALQFLSNAPMPLEVLSSFATQLSPSSWSGSRADIMERRLSAFEVLAMHENQDIVNAATGIIEQSMAAITEEREQERRRDEDREQRFE